MAAEAEAAREARAKVINTAMTQKMDQYYFQYQCHANSIHNHHNIWFQVIAAEGEQKASRALREAAETIADSHSALQVYTILHTFYHMTRTID